MPKGAVGIDLRQCGEHAQAIEDLQRWQKAQNGTLGRLETKIDGQRTWLIGVLTAIILDLASRLIGR